MVLKTAREICDGFIDKYAAALIDGVALTGDLVIFLEIPMTETLKTETDDYKSEVWSKIILTPESIPEITMLNYPGVRERLIGLGYQISEGTDTVKNIARNYITPKITHTSFWGKKTVTLGKEYRADDIVLPSLVVKTIIISACCGGNQK